MLKDGTQTQYIIIVHMQPRSCLVYHTCTLLRTSYHPTTGVVTISLVNLVKSATNWHSNYNKRVLSVRSPDWLMTDDLLPWHQIGIDDSHAELLVHPSAHCWSTSVRQQLIISTITKSNSKREDGKDLDVSHCIVFFINHAYGLASYLQPPMQSDWGLKKGSKGILSNLYGNGSLIWQSFWSVWDLFDAFIIQSAVHYNTTI